ncbi:beta-galactosidase GalB [Niastella vici]|nr:beta-galactosidase GalB [Niastella vici]
MSWLPLITTGQNKQAALFDANWLFRRVGLQADGSVVAEPTGLQEISADETGWRKLDLPHDWAIEGPFRIDLAGETGKLPYKGIGWYRKHFTLPRTDSAKQLFLDFDGAMAYAQVWLNGHYLGTWPYGYSSFRMELTPFLQFGKENVLAVRVSTEHWDSRWYSGAGIYRHVWLVKTNPVHVAHWGTFITTPHVTRQKAVVQVQVKVDNQSGNPVLAGVHTELFTMDNHNKPGVRVATLKDSVLSIAPGKTAEAMVSAVVVNPQFWDLESPHRYLARTTITANKKLVDTYYTAFGIRTLQFTARNGFLLNGRRVQIQGTCNHHDAGALGAAINTSALRRQLTILKEMGCNALRTSHNPPAPELLELADEMGFLVWDEAFDCWKHGKKKEDYNKLYDEWHEKDLEALVHRDRNHPSVFIWSIGNEVMDQRDSAMTAHLANIVKREDPTRPVSNGYNDPDGGREVGAAVALDIMGVNYFFSRQPQWDADARYANKPTIGSETSSCISSRGEYFFDKKYANWQVSSYDNAYPGWGCSPDEQFRTNAKFAHLLGEFVWTGFDYLGEPTPYNSDETNLLNFRNDPSMKEALEQKLSALRKSKAPARSSYFGIVDLCGFPKDRYYLYQSHWRPNFPMVHILPHWNWKNRIDSIVPVHIYTSGDEVELFLNGQSLGRKKKAPQQYRLQWDSVVYKPGELVAIAYKAGKQWAREVRTTTGEAAALQLQANRSSIKGDGQDLVFITISVTDSKGRLVPTARHTINCRLQGEGEMVATDNGDATSFIPFSSSVRPAFNGLMLVVVKAHAGARGKLKLIVESPGLTTGVLEISCANTLNNNKK